MTNAGFAMTDVGINSNSLEQIIRIVNLQLKNAISKSGRIRLQSSLRAQLNGSYFFTEFSTLYPTNSSQRAPDGR